MGVELSEEIIDVMKKIKDAIKESSFEINHFEVESTGAGGEMIVIDIRRHNVKDDQEYKK
jgi:nitrate reductase NapAB chaperone NapD